MDETVVSDKDLKKAKHWFEKKWRKIVNKNEGDLAEACGYFYSEYGAKISALINSVIKPLWGAHSVLAEHVWEDILSHIRAFLVSECEQIVPVSTED